MAANNNSNSSNCMKNCENSEYYIPLTIERHLKNYSECNGHIERHEVLWHEWNHNKRWLIQIQQLILPSFPSYSRHDVSHSEAVLHNIEMILGEKNIRSLSPTDCFVLLHTVYIHDIGMCITHEDKVKILKDGKFHEFLEQLAENKYSKLGKYADLLLKECFKNPDYSKEEKQQHILNKKLEVYYAITYLIAEYRRKDHGDVSGKRLIEWIDKPDKLGIGFSTIELPNRLFHIIANCAAAHTKWEVDDILCLNQEDSGFVRDYVHPRFITVLLQLGDALDMDNNRFHPLTHEYLGEIPEISEVHYRKHKSIRRLRITNQKISISADCETQDELRLVRMECDSIRDILKNATFYWSVIKPKESNMCLPTFDKTELLLKNNKIPTELVTARFKISQDRAFNLIKGTNIYKDENFVFLRELLQNAADATKFQYFRDCKRKLARLGQNEDSLLNPIKIAKLISPLDYPINISLYMKKQKEGILEDITSEDFDGKQNALEGYECGVLVKISDYGTGISEKDISLIADVGSSYSSRKAEIKKMPSWLQPTGTFGIGLQSVFLAGQKLKAITHTRDEKEYEITFHPRQGTESGYINARPLEESANEWDIKPYGTIFEVFVPYHKKKLHSQSPDTWDGKDPFETGYEASKAIRHTRELLKQMALYIVELTGESLFPICIEIWDESKEAPEKLYSVNFTEKFDKIMLKIHTKESKSLEQNALSNVTWAYDLKNSENIHEADGNIYHLDCEKGKLYIWDQQYNAYACLGIKRILEQRKHFNAIEKENYEQGVSIFYKGIQVTKKIFKEDSDLIEYIDLKGTLKPQYLKLNRNAFSEEGHKYLEEVYKNIIIIMRQALQYFGTQQNKQNKYIYIETILSHINNLMLTDEHNSIPKRKEAGELILSATALIYFSMITEKSEHLECSNERNISGWIELLHSMQNLLQELKEPLWKNSTFFNLDMRVLEKDRNYFTPKQGSILDVIDDKEKYIIVSQRTVENNGWKHYLLQTKEFHADIKRKLKQLRHCTNTLERKKLIIELEEIPKKLLDANFLNDKNLKPSVEKKEQLILKWLINNVPTMAMYASDDGNTRINVLDIEICDSVFFSLRMKKLLWNRIQEYSKYYERFCIPVLSGYQYLCLSEPRMSIKFVKRGKLSSIGYGVMIFPLAGKQMTEFVEYCQNSLKELEKEIQTLYNIIFQNILDKIKTKNEENRIPSEGKYWSNIESILIEFKKQNLSEQFFEQYEEEKKDNKLRESLLEEEYKFIVNNLNNETKNPKISDRETALWQNKIKLKLYHFKNLLMQYESGVDERTLFDKYLKQDNSYPNIINYIQKHSKIPLNESQIEDFYFCFICELKDALLYFDKKAYLEELSKKDINFNLSLFLN